MTTPTPDRAPLWRVMRAADASLVSDLTTPEARALRAIADEMVLQFDPWLEEHAAVADWLEAEARLAEQGDG